VQLNSQNFIDEVQSDEDGDGFCDLQVNTLAGFGSRAQLVTSASRHLIGETYALPGFFEFMYNVRKQGKALLGALVERLVSSAPESQ
jgi:hypothetical protein